MKNDKDSIREVLIKRVFDAPPRLVWQAWTDPEKVKKWWGPKGFTAPYAKIDLRVGGTYHNCMRSPEGKDYWSRGVYRQIVELKKIVCTDSFSDNKGAIVPATDYGMSASFPLELLITVTFEETGGKTTLTLRHEGLPPGKDRQDCQAGWSESFDKLSEFLANECAAIGTCTQRP